MATESSIEWTDKTWNPVRGCTPVSEGCKNCYAMRQAHRFSGEGKAYAGLTKLTTKGPRWTGAIRTVPELLDAPLRWRKPARVFVNSMSDLFHPDVPFDFLVDVFVIMALTPHHTYQVLTKRPERMAEILSDPDFSVNVGIDVGERYEGEDDDDSIDEYLRGLKWPLPNVWLGTSVEDQAAADERIPHLLRTPAAVRFLSCEPLLGPVDVRPYLGSIPGVLCCPACGFRTDRFSRCPNDDRELVRDIGIDWVITGGESGPGARPCDIAWIESIVEQCQATGVPVFVKQLGAKPFELVCVNCDRTDRELNEQKRACVQHETVGSWITQRDKKGGDMQEWPQHLRVREFPQAVNR